MRKSRACKALLQSVWRWITPHSVLREAQLAELFACRRRFSAFLHPFKQAGFGLKRNLLWLAFFAMGPDAYRITRATIDHLQQLRPLWQAAELPFWELVKRLTEFHVVETREGKVLGAVGLQIAGRHGRIHSEAFVEPAAADELRALLWERLMSVANHHGLIRLWTQEKAPFWQRAGMAPAKMDELQKMPADWKSLYPRWLTVQLRDEVAATSLEREFALFEQAEKQRTQRALKQARTLRTVATLIVTALFVFVIIVVISLLTRSSIQQPRF